jgi:hypothetical protein
MDRSSTPSQDEVDSAVKKLLELKAQNKELTGVDIAGGNKREKVQGFL